MRKYALVSFALFTLVYVSISYTYLLHPSIFLEDFKLKSAEPKLSLKPRLIAFGANQRNSRLFRQKLTLLSMDESDRSSAGLEVENYNAEETKSFLETWANQRGASLSKYANSMPCGEILCTLNSVHTRFLFTGGESLLGIELYNYLHALEDNSVKDIISTWSASRVNQYLSDFARSNDLKLATPSPQISGNLFFSSISYSMCDYFESASDLDVIKLYYQIHPTEGRESFDETFRDFEDLNSKEVLFLLATYAEKNTLRMNLVAYTLLDGKELLSAVADQEFAKKYFGCESKKCEELVSKLRESKKLYSDYEMQELATSFSGQFSDPCNGVDHFVQYVKECCTEYRSRPAVYFSPYFALVQCSGSGKSRMLLESSKKLRALYVCFRSGATGYPPRTVRAITQLFEGIDVANSDAYLKALVERLKRAEISARKHLPIPGLSARTSKVAMFDSERLSDSVWNLKDIAMEEELPDSEEPVLLILDEARALLDNSPSGLRFGDTQFTWFRRALHNYWDTYKNAKLFAVMVDTSSRIKNFSPSLLADPSARQVKFEGGAFLFHPFVWLESFDAVFHSLKLPAGTRDLTPLLKNSYYLQAGRPMVAIPFSDPVQQTNFLLRKLHGGFSGRTPVPNLGHLSVVLARLATAISCLSTTAAELVAEHMVYLLASDLSREQMFVANLAEPRLALAAARAWNTAGELENNLLPALQRAVTYDVISAGDRGEVASQVILLQAFDAACLAAGKNSGECVPLVRFLEQLLPQQSLVDVKNAIPDSLLGSSVACGQFVLLAHYMSLDTNTALAERHCGALFKARQPGVDIIVPIIAPVPAMVIFQIKNLAAQGTASAEIDNLMNPSIAFNDQKILHSELVDLDKNCVRVYMQLGANKFSADCSKGGALHIYGLSSRCLSTPVACALEMLLEANNCIESFVLDQTAVLETNISPFPLPDDIKVIRRILPFVIDNKPQWNDLTVIQLKSVCTKCGLTFDSKVKKQDLIQILKEGVGPEPIDNV